MKEEHFGLYTCKATNYAGSVNVSVELFKGKVPELRVVFAINLFIVLLLADTCVPCNSTTDYCRHGKCCYIADLKQPQCR